MLAEEQMSIRWVQGRGREHTARGTGQLSFHQPACSDLLDAMWNYT